MYDYCDLEPDGDTAIFGLHAIFGFLTTGSTKEAIWRHDFGLCVIVIKHSFYL